MESRRLGGYELREVLGEGGMGMVYLAHDPTLDRPAAVKVIRAKALSREGNERCLREARSCSKITPRTERPRSSPPGPYSVD
jgi:serine/threonine-protein kinase